MKKVITTITAVTFALGLASAALAQTKATEAEKPAVKTEAPAPQTQVAPQGAANPEVTPPAKEETKAEAKTVKPGEKGKSKKEIKKAKAEKKSAVPFEKPKEEKK